MPVTNAHVVIIGSGVAGAGTAFALARRGAAVTVVDAARDGTATAAGAGIVQPWSSGSTGGPLYELYAKGAEFYPELLGQLERAGAGPVDFRRNGAIVVNADAGELDAVQERLHRRRQASPLMGEVTRLTGEAARELFPPLAPGLAAVHISGGARVDGRSLRRALLDGARRHGAVVRAGAAALVDGPGRLAVQVDDERLDADAVVVAAGAWTDAVLEPTGHRVAVAPQRGQITHLRLDGVDTTHWPSVLTAHYLVPFDDSRVVVGATREAGSGFDARLTAAGQLEVLAAALEVAPGLAGATVVETRVGLRPLAVDGFPRVGAVPGMPGVFVNTGFGAVGLTIGPFVGDALARLVLGEPGGTDLAPFAPNA